MLQFRRSVDREELPPVSIVLICLHLTKRKVKNFCGCLSVIILNPITPEQAEQVQPYFWRSGDLQYIFIILHHSQYRFQLFNKKCDVNKTIHIC